MSQKQQQPNIFAIKCAGCACILARTVGAFLSERGLSRSRISVEMIDPNYPRDDVSAVFDLLVKNFRRESKYKFKSKVHFVWRRECRIELTCPCMLIQYTRTKEEACDVLKDIFARAKLSGLDANMHVVLRYRVYANRSRKPRSPPHKQ